MAWSFGDSFDLYAAAADMTTGYWDSGTVPFNFAAGRFSGQRMNATGPNNSLMLVKSSGQNDAVHHIVVAFLTTSTFGASNIGGGFTLSDGTTAQCSIGFRLDGAILLIAGLLNSGTVLATYSSAFAANNTWYAFEFEVVINNTTGSFKVRKNGNTVDDFSATGLDTQASANAYANKLTVAAGPQATTMNIGFDDLFWKSDASSVAWLGDLRCYTRMPASDASVTFSRTPASAYPLFTSNSTASITSNVARYAPFTAGNNGSIGTATLTISTASTANIKCAIYSDNAGVPGTALGSATPVNAPGIGTATFTFGTPVSITAGTKYWIAFVADANSGAYGVVSGGTAGCQWNAATYASFPTNNPTVTTGVPQLGCGLGVTPPVNFPFVAEAQQDALTTYVYSSTPGDEDFYGISSIASTPATVIATTVRGYMQKSDAGTRTAAVQLKSGATTVASSTLTLTTSGWQWAWRTDTIDPATGAAWTAAGVNAAQIGPKVIA